MGRKKAHKQWCKAWRRALTNLHRNLREVTRYHGGALFHEAPGEMTISVEAMLFTLFDELDDWPETWVHTCWWDLTRTVPRCTCGTCMHGVPSRDRYVLSHTHMNISDGSCADCARRLEHARMREDARRMLVHLGLSNNVDAAADLIADAVDDDAGIFSLLEMGPPQGHDP